MLESLIKESQKDWKYHFFILHCRVLFPFNFARHFWVVTIDNWKVTRREVRHFKNKKNPELWHIHINLFKPRSWLWKYIWKTTKHRKPYLSYHISWWQNSLAHEVVSFVSNDYIKYNYIWKYNFFVWPNCNTFVQWIINSFPKIKFQMPRNAFGKNYK